MDAAYKIPEARAEKWRIGKLPVGQLSGNRDERQRQWESGLCGSWCLNKVLFDGLRQLGAIDADGFLTPGAFMAQDEQMMVTEGDQQAMPGGVP